MTGHQSIVWKNKYTGRFIAFDRLHSWNIPNSPDLDNAYCGNKVPYDIRVGGIYLPVPVWVTRNVNLLEATNE